MTDTKALRGLLEKVKLENWYFRECNADDGYVIVNAEGTPCGKVFDYKTNVILGNVVKALPDLLDAYEERDRLKAALDQIANYGRGEFPSLNNMADGFNAVQKIAEEALEPKQ